MMNIMVVITSSSFYFETQGYVKNAFFGGFLNNFSVLAVMIYWVKTMYIQNFLFEYVQSFFYSYDNISVIVNTLGAELLNETISQTLGTEKQKVFTSLR